MNKVKITATIPTVQYGNIQPEIEIEADNYEDALLLAETRLQYFWDKYAEKGKELVVNSGGTTERLTDMFGNEIDYDAINHVYSWGGEVYLSGSQYADSFRKPFDKAKISQAMATKYGVSADEIVKAWELKGEVSRNFGNAIHGALQLREQFADLTVALGNTTNVHDHPEIKRAVDSFILSHAGEKSLSEQLVVDHTNKRAGRIDRLLVVSKGVYRVQDFKTNATIAKDLPIYWKQTEFYKGLIEANKAKVEGMDIFHYDGHWETYTQ